MYKYALSLAFIVGTLLYAETALAQMDDEPPPPPPLGDVDEPPPPPPPSRARTGGRRGNAKQVKGGAATDTDSPVVRANGEEGNMGLFFRFGGLATMAATGDSIKGNQDAINTQLGIKFVMSESIMLPLFFGMSITMDKTGDADATNNFSMDLGAGLEYHFRIWRRLSPFFGALLKLGFHDLTGDDNLAVRFHVGPTIGIEYYIADRVSLSAAYMLMISLVASAVGTDNTVIDFDFTTKSGYDVAASSGGDLTLTFYF